MTASIWMQTLKKLKGVNFVGKVITVLHSNPSCVSAADANASLSIFGKPPPPSPSPVILNGHFPLCREYYLPKFKSC